MSDRLVMILANDNSKVLEMGLIYARNVVKNGWMDDMKLFLFGPSEVTIATDPDLQQMVKEIISEGTVPQACKWCSDKYKVSEELSRLGCAVEYIGASVSEAIRDGYTPMTW